MVAASADTTTNDQQHLHTEVHPKRTNGNQPAVHSLWRQRPALAYRSASQICDAAVVPCNGQVVTCNSQLAVDGWVAFPFVWWNQVLNHVAYARKKKSQLHLHLVSSARMKRTRTPLSQDAAQLQGIPLGKHLALIWRLSRSPNSSCFIIFTLLLVRHKQLPFLFVFLVVASLTQAFPVCTLKPSNGKPVQGWCACQSRLLWKWWTSDH